MDAQIEVQHRHVHLLEILTIAYLLATYKVASCSAGRRHIPLHVYEVRECGKEHNFQWHKVLVIAFRFWTKCWQDAQDNTNHDNIWIAYLRRRTQHPILVALYC